MFRLLPLTLRNDYGSYLVRSCSPPKVVNFVWRAALNILPARSLFSARLSGLELACPLCGLLETNVHLCWDYVVVGDVWNMEYGWPFGVWCRTGTAAPTNLWCALGLGRIKMNVDVSTIVEQWLGSV